MEELVGRLNFTGDIRSTHGREVIYSPKHGPVRPLVAEYDEATNRTSIGYAPVDQRTEIAPGEESLSVAWELMRRKRERSAAWARAVAGGGIR
jgi:hypothetical protein